MLYPEFMRTQTYIQHSCTVHEHRLDVPLDHSRPLGNDNPSIEIFAREIIRPGGENLPHLLFLQGGPGGKSPRPGDFRDGWLGRLLKDYRLVLLDQRGTGQSTRMDTQALVTSGLYATDAERAHALTFFRQDQIVRDAEMLRQHITGGKPWTTLGQSYGGFITMSYLSLAPEGLEACLVTGGLPGLVDIDDIYRLTYRATAARNRVYFERYPNDERTVRDIAHHLTQTEELLPTGERLTPSRLRMIGMSLGTTTATDVLHYLLEGPWVTVGGQRRLSEEFLSELAGHISMAPMYGVLHESIYAGATPQLAGRATNWSADRLAHETPGFHPDADPRDLSEPFYLTGEHMMRSFFDEDPALAPLAGTTDKLATRTDWPAVYLPDVLRQNRIPVAAAIYFEDMFVPVELSCETASLIGARTWVTNEYQHDGLRASGDHVVDHLLSLLHD